MARKKGKKRVKKKVNTTVTKIKRRSPVAKAAILRKGGAHQKSRSGDRQKQKRVLRKALADNGYGRKTGQGGKQNSFMTALSCAA